VSDPRKQERIGQVDAVLEEIGAGALPRIVVYNKIDRLEIEPGVVRDADGTVQQVWISATRGLGLDVLQRAVAERLARVARRAEVRVPVTAGALRARLYAAGTVLAERTAADGAFELTLELPEVELLALARQGGVEILAVSGGADGSGGSAGLLLPGATPCAPQQAYLQSAPPGRASKIR
jgi:GTP-binding protein HflX